jgi:hypothetical protein
MSFTFFVQVRVHQDLHLFSSQTWDWWKLWRAVEATDGGERQRKGAGESKAEQKQRQNSAFLKAESEVWDRYWTWVGFSREGPPFPVFSCSRKQV